MGNSPSRRAFMWLGTAALCSSQAQQSSPLPPDAIARFHLNNGGYLVDVGKFLEAVEEFQTAQNVASGAELQAQSLSAEAHVRALFLDDPTGALRNYEQILQKFRATSFYEMALFQIGMLTFQLQRLQEARAFFLRYLQEFPNGTQSATAEYMREETETLLTEKRLPPPTPSPSISGEISVRLGEWDTVVVSCTDDIRLRGESVQTLGRYVTMARRNFEFFLNSRRISGEPVELSSSAPLALGSKTYRGRIHLRGTSSTNFEVVNRLSLEDYLAGVIHSEMPASFSLEALKAQAVAARTYALYNVQHPRRPGVYDVFNDTRSQGYAGINGESVIGRQAVTATAGEVLLHDGRAILACFDSNNGGKTADPSCVFKLPLPYLHASDDPLSRSEPYGSWERFFPVAEIGGALQRSGYKLGTVQNLVPLSLCSSGRIVELSVVHTEGKLNLRTRSQFRVALNRHLTIRYKPENLPEILMEIQKENEGFRILGGGWGHGVGLSQYGARARARRGETYRQILSAYYPRTTLQEVY